MYMYFDATSYEYVKRKKRCETNCISVYRKKMRCVFKTNCRINKR